MRNWKDLAEFKFFSEAEDATTSDERAKWLLDISNAACYLLMTFAVLGVFSNPKYAYCGLLVAFVVTSATAWCLGRRGRAKNGLIWIATCTGLLVAIK